MNTKLRKLNNVPESRSIILLLGLLIIMITYFAFISKFFLTKNNIINIMRQTAEMGIITIPTAILIISGGIDMSLGSTVGFCAISLGLMLKAGIPISLAVFLTILIGAMIGIFNGFFVAKLKIPGIVSTIGTMVLIRGLCYIVNKGNPVNGFSKGFIALGNKTVINIPISFFVLILLYVAAAIIMKKSSFGVYTYALGNNEKTTRYCGINTDNFKWILYIINGVVISIASVFLLARLGSAEATLGQNYDLDVLASVLIGGISILGGKGNIIGAFLGLIVIGVLRNGLNIIGLSVLYQSIILGVLLILTAAKWKNIKN
ncbi:MAG TPA: ABC transporter permease [Clostridiales bacterium]|nr:ABC transporter permease [Clostridiales bacterium]